jgi:hypothetical protein
MGLIVSLDKQGEASGELFWDDGVSFKYGFNLKLNSMSILIFIMIFI